MSRGYVSPVPAERRLDYRKRVGGNATHRRVHIWPGELLCNPDHCRECYREHHWTEGQTHG